LSDTLISLLTAEQGAVREFIGQRLKESKLELEKAEGALEEYKRTQKMIAPDVQSKAMLDKVIGIDKLKAENRVNLMSTQARLSSIEQQLAGEKPGFIADSPLIQQHKSKLADLEVELVSALPKYSDSHPKVISLRAAIDEVKTKLKAEAALVVNAEAASGNTIHQNLLQAKITSEAEVAATMAQKAAIENIIASSEKEMSALPAKEQGISRLMREALVAQEIYIMLDKRYEEARINEVMRPSDVQVLDAAIVPELPIRPRIVLNAVIGAILGLGIGIVLSLILEYKNWTIRNEEEAKQLLNLPVMGIVPDMDKIIVGRKGPFWNRIRALFS
ncbi:MAG: lipopolysaccharide biosynthesis protein, partial [Firmicutes bacterium]|nr:lipopolysaccharide biosynthesis protein [Bacillota bacterium]